MSVKEKKFIEIVESSVQLKDGHYKMKLPFKTPHVNMTNNLFVAKQKGALKRRLLKDESFHNRISTIREASDISQWRHIPTAQYSADDTSRGLKIEHLVQKESKWRRWKIRKLIQAKDQHILTLILSHIHEQQAPIQQ